MDRDVETMASLSNVIEVRLLHPEKAEPPMLVTLFGMVTEVKLLHPEKAELPMLVTLLGIVTDVTRGLHFTTTLFFIINPSLVSSSHRVAPQLLPLVNDVLFINESVIK